MTFYLLALFAFACGWLAGRADFFDLGRFRWQRDRVQERDGSFVPEPPEAA